MAQEMNFGLELNETAAFRLKACVPYGRTSPVPGSSQSCVLTFAAGTKQLQLENFAAGLCNEAMPKQQCHLTIDISAMDAIAMNMSLGVSTEEFQRLGGPEGSSSVFSIATLTALDATMFQY